VLSLSLFPAGEAAKQAAPPSLRAVQPCRAACGRSLWGQRRGADLISSAPARGQAPARAQGVRPSCCCGRRGAQPHGPSLRRRLRPNCFRDLDSSVNGSCRPAPSTEEGSGRTGAHGMEDLGSGIACRLVTSGPHGGHRRKRAVAHRRIQAALARSPRLAARGLRADLGAAPPCRRPRALWLGQKLQAQCIPEPLRAFASPSHFGPLLIARVPRL